MTTQMKAPFRRLSDDLVGYHGGAGQNVFAFWKPLRYVGSANFNIGHSLAQNPSNVATASLKRCELCLDLWQTFKKAHQKLLHKIGQHRVLSGSQIGTYWKRAPLVQHTVSTMLERAVAMRKENE